jgi:hypothetical protein
MRRKEIARNGKILTNMKSRSRRQYVSSYSLAVAYIGLGERDTALTQLQKAYEDREDQVALMKIETRSTLFTRIRASRICFAESGVTLLM